MRRQPDLETSRLLLRPFRISDADAVQRLAGDRAVADTTLNIPYPYEDGLAEKWISNHRDWFERGEQAVFAITFKESCATTCLQAVASPCHEDALPLSKQWHAIAGALVGTVGLQIHPQDRRAELGYWIGKPYWSQGYATEAARAVVGFGFEQLGLNRIYAQHFASQSGFRPRHAKTRHDPRRPPAAARPEVGPLRGPGRVRHSQDGIIHVPS